jgi:uncharacterized protein
MPQVWINGLLGGLIIGTAVSIMLLFNGRVTGISGIVYGTINRNKGDTSWRYYFIAGLLLGSLLLKIFYPTAFPENILTSNLSLVIAGLLVGFGTVLGSGCTSGHGVCGISRLSPRSLVSTIVYISAGVLMVLLTRKLGLNI